MGEWKEVKLEEIAGIENNSWKVGDEECPYIALEHIEEGKLRLNGFGNTGDIASNKYRFTEKNFLFGRLRPYFRKVVRPKFSGICSTDIWVVKAIENNDLDFLFYLFASQEFVDLAYSGSSGTKMPRADWKFMKETEWRLPPFPEQKAIASVLSSLDDKIDLLIRQNKTLEAIAETLFRQWFVEEAKEDWGQGVLPDEFDFTMGQSPPGSSFNEARIGTPMFQGNADFGFRFPSERVYTTNPKRFAEELDTLISVRAPVGAQNMALTRCCIGRGVAAFKSKHSGDLYTYTYFKLRSLMRKIQQFNDEGTVFGSIGKDDFQKMVITLPPIKIVQSFDREVKPLNDRIINNCKAIGTFEILRDTLLPKLISGKIRVGAF